MLDFMLLCCSHLHDDAFGCDRMCYDAIWLFGIQIYILYLCLYDGHVGYLLHYCFKILYANMSDVNGLNRYFNTYFFGYDIIRNYT